LEDDHECDHYSHDDQKVTMAQGKSPKPQGCQPIFKTLKSLEKLPGSVIRYGHNNISHDYIFFKMGW